LAEDYTVTHTDDTTPVFTTGNKEDWSDTIWNISPTDLPLFRSIKRKNINVTTYEFYTEVLKNASAKISDAQVQNFTPSATEDARKKCQNYTMILQDAATVSRTQEKHKKVGIKSELDHQLMNKMMVMKKSAELRCLAGVAGRSPKSTTYGGVAYGLPGLVGLYGDIVLHIDGTTRVYGTANTTNVNVVEEDFENDTTNTKYGWREFKSTLKKVWKLGSRPKLMITTPEDKEYISLWDTSGVTRESGKINEVEEMVDIVITDFGKVRAIPHEDLVKYTDNGTDAYDGTAGTMVTDFAILFDPAYVKLLMFDDFFTDELGKTTDGITRFAGVEFSIEASAPHGIGIFDFAGNHAAHTYQIGLPSTAAGYAAAYS
jgi:hypothetical protein